MMQFFQRIFFSTYRFFKLFIFMPLTGNLPAKSCRYLPSCNQYCHQAVSKFGFRKGGRLCLKRILRCHPFSSHSPIDPVPDQL